MKDLRAATREILRLAEEVSGKSVQLMRDDSLPLFAALVIARRGAAYHLIRYRPTNEPVDYWLAYQAGFLVRLFECPPSERFDFAPATEAGHLATELMGLGQPMTGSERNVAEKFGAAVAQWSLTNLRSLSIGMRIDAWIAEVHPSLAELQRAALLRNLQSNLNVVGQRVGKLAVPSALLGMDAAYALFAEQHFGIEGFTVPYEAAGALSVGKDLLTILDTTPATPIHDRELVDRWAKHLAIGNWYRWQPYEP